VEINFDSDESYFREIELELTEALRKIPKAEVIENGEYTGDPVWYEGSDRDEDPPEGYDAKWSYHEYFLSPDGEAFEYAIKRQEIVEPPEFESEEECEEYYKDPELVTTIHYENIGWRTRVSLLAPFAEICFDDGSQITDEDPQEEYDAGTPYESDWRKSLEEFRTRKGEAAYEALIELHAKILAVLEKHDFVFLPYEECEKRVPWLRGSIETNLGMKENGVNVRDAFFFEEPEV